MFNMKNTDNNMVFGVHPVEEEVLIRFRVAQQEEFVVRIVPAPGVPVAVPLGGAVVHGRGQDGGLFR